MRYKLQSNQFVSHAQPGKLAAVENTPGLTRCAMCKPRGPRASEAPASAKTGAANMTRRVPMRRSPYPSAAPCPHMLALAMTANDVRQGVTMKLNLASRKSAIGPHKPSVTPPFQIRLKPRNRFGCVCRGLSLLFLFLGGTFDTGESHPQASASRLHFDSPPNPLRKRGDKQEPRRRKSWISP